MSVVRSELCGYRGAAAIGLDELDRTCAKDAASRFFLDVAFVSTTNG